MLIQIGTRMLWLHSLPNSLMGNLLLIRMECGDVFGFTKAYFRGRLVTGAQL